MIMCANVNTNGEISLNSEIKNLASYDELLNEMCCGLEIQTMTMTKDGIVIWNEEESEIDFVRFNC